MSDGVLWASYSQLVAHRKCPQAWLYGSVQKLVKDDLADVKVERDIGSWWAMLRAAEAIDRGSELESLKWAPKELKSVDGGPTLSLPSPSLSTLTAQVFELAWNWWHQQTPLVKDEWDARLGEGLPDRLDALFIRWREQWAEEIATEQPLAVEMGWQRDLPKLGDSDPHCRLVGYVDEVYFDTKRQMVVVRDDKAHKALSTQTAADDMMDSQLQFYAWGASQQIKEWGVGPVRATAYDRIRTVKPKTPQLTLAGTLSKSITDYDLTTYLQWAMGPDGLGQPYPGRLKDGSAAGFYLPDEALMEKLATPVSTSIWFQRTLTPLNANLIRAHLRAAVDSAADLHRTKQRAKLTNEAPRNLTVNCRYCDFAALCRAQMVGGSDGEYNLADYKLKVKVKDESRRH